MLKLSGNALGVAGACALAKMLATACGGLQELHLDGTSAGDKGGAAIARLLLTSALTHLYLQDNYSVGTETARAMAQSLAVNSHLTYLSLAKTHLGACLQPPDCSFKHALYVNPSLCLAPVLA